MNKKLAAVLLAGALLFGAAPLQAQESSSIDAVTAGVAPIQAGLTKRQRKK